MILYANSGYSIAGFYNIFFFPSLYQLESYQQVILLQ